MGEICAGLLFVQYFIRSRGMEHKHTHTQYDMSIYTSVFRWATSTGWEEAPRPAAPMVSTPTSSWTEPAHTPPAHRTGQFSYCAFYCGSSSVLSNSSFTKGNRFTWTQLLIAWAQHPSILIFFFFYLQINVGSFSRVLCNWIMFSEIFS